MKPSRRIRELTLLATLLAGGSAWSLPREAASASGETPDAQAASTIVDLGDGLKISLRFVEPGTFKQGSEEAKLGALVRQTTIRRGFWLAETETTVAAFERFTAASKYRTEAEVGTSGGSGFDGTGTFAKNAKYTWRTPGYKALPTMPVSLVTYADAVAFAAWLTRNNTSGLAFRLPTEAEWELAASREKAGTPVAGSAAKQRGPSPVCEQQVPGARFCDLLGNVNEWTADRDRARVAGAATDPHETNGDRQVLKGGSWFKDPIWAQPGARYSNTPGTRNADNGFRVAADTVAVQAPVAPSPTAPVPVLVESGGTTSSPFFPVLTVLVGVVSLFAMFFVFRKKSATNAQRSGNAGYSLRVGQDGFFIDTHQYAANSVVYYSCYVNNTQVRSSAPLAGPQTFVFTGGSPQNLRIERIEDPSGGFRGNTSSSASPSRPGEAPDPRAYETGAIYGATHSAWDNTSQGNSWNSNDSNNNGSSGGSFGGWPSAY